MNNIFIGHGHVGQSPKSVVFGKTGNKVVKFSVAIKEFSANPDEQKTMWIDCEAWNGLGDRVLKTVTKGREIVVNGRLAISDYTTEVEGKTQKVKKPVIKLTGYDLCGKKPQAPATESAEQEESAE